VFQQARVAKPMPSYVAGFRQWLSLDRHVMKGQAVRLRDPRPGHRPFRLSDAGEADSGDDWLVGGT
jgi:hypothetical protein